ncbi:FAD-dependent oxidoreductase [Prolixibacteraceae bacterium JC049]|nr:FAD-dependent oxidoreductase [Prolixibacteraceae bacterium JC049]
MKKIFYLFFSLILCGWCQLSRAQNQVLIEAENFKTVGGWKVDQQFTHIMGSSYLLAHGMGVPVDAAKTKVKLPSDGEYKIWVRTKDWVPEHKATPGTFQLKLNGNILPQTFGVNEDWNWVNGGVAQLAGDSISLELIDQTGFDGRCDAIYLTTDHSFVPPNGKEDLAAWRRTLSNLPATPASAGNFDVVIVGGGMAGCCAAIAAAREGCSVALIQDRPVLGGNASDEIRVHTIGMEGYRIVEEVNTAHYPNGSDQAKVDQVKRNEVMETEPNVTLFLSTRAFGVNREGRLIKSIDAKHIQTGEELRFFGKQFIDCTGDGWIGYWAENRVMIGREAQGTFNESLAPATKDNLMMGTTLMFNSVVSNKEEVFPDVPWAMDVAKDYTATKGEWFWEYGIGLDPFADAEHIRDHLLRAIYGAFSNAKKNPANVNRKLNWVGYVQGKRESRRLVGEHILTENDVRNSVEFEDGVVIEKREIDLHLPKSEKYDFLTKALFTHIQPYHIPFRSFIAADLDNLMMAGRCLSASHVGLGSPRVMNTVGQMGVATGVAAGLCKKYAVNPREVYQNHVEELKKLVKKDAVLADESIIWDNTDSNVTYVGNWAASTFNPKFYGTNYIHDGNEEKGSKSAVFDIKLEESGKYSVYSRHTAGDSRATNVPFKIKHHDGVDVVYVNQQEKDGKWINLGTFYFDKDETNSVTISNEGTDGHVIIDAIAMVPQFSTGANVDLKKNEMELTVFVSENEVVFDINTTGGKGFLELFTIDGKKVVHVDSNFSNGDQKLTMKYERFRNGIYIALLVVDGQSVNCKFSIN